MARFRIILVGLIAWLVFLFNVERPDIAGIDISATFYIMSALIILGILMLPDLSQINVWRVFIPLALLYGVIRVVYPEGDRDSFLFYSSVAEIAMLFVTLFITRMISLSFLNMEIAIEDVVMDKQNAHILSRTEGEEQINLELSRARRYNTEVAILYLHLSLIPELQEQPKSQFDVQHIFRKRYIQGQVAQNVEALLHRGDIIAWYNENLVVCVPSFRYDQALQLAQDLYTRLNFRLGIKMNMGVVVFPQDGLVYDDLIAEAAFRTFHFKDAPDDTVSPFVGNVPFDDDDMATFNDMGIEMKPAPQAPDIPKPPVFQQISASAKDLLNPPPIISAEIEKVFPARRESWHEEISWIEDIQYRSSSSRVIYKRIKRIMDLILVVVAGPFILLGIGLLGFLVYLDSGRPIFYHQKRTGEKGEEFEMYKFRTMVTNSKEILKELGKKGLAQVDEDGNLTAPLKLNPDPRVTRLGRILRKSSLDELPQLYNVLRGEMSLVGPRPTSWKLKTYQLFHTERLSVKPGVTGLLQVYERGNTDFNTWLKWDIKYIDKMCFYMDIRILIMTFAMILFKRKGAR